MDQDVNSKVIQIERSVERWLREFVIELGLCPFAKHVVDNESIRYKVVTSHNNLDALVDLESELVLLQLNQEIATSLLITPFVLNEFDDYLDFLESAQQLLEESQLLGVFQLASFHPQYQFSGTTPDAAENFSNRSPYPMIHILRESQVKTAIDTFGDPSTIPTRNIKALQVIGVEKLRKKINTFISSEE
jgi:hypothetical protein